jgi:uroporphyrinogen decarboxylase
MAESGCTSLFLSACRREPVERTPIWIMRQAGRYLPEYRRLREQYDFLTTCRTPELACELTLQPIRRFALDAAIVFSDILVTLPGMGLDVSFTPGPHIGAPLRTRAAIDELRVPDPHECTPYVFGALRAIRRELAPEVALIGFAGAPFTMATYMVEGGSSKSFSWIKRLMWQEPEAAHKLLATCADTVACYLTAQIEAGADAVMLFDTWAGILSPPDHAAFAAPYAKRVFDHVAAASDGRHAITPRIYYAGDVAGCLENCRAIGADVIGLDWRMSLSDARRRLGPEIALQGNLDPTILLGPPDLIRERAEAVLQDADGDPTAGPGPARGHIFNLGHGILPDTPPDHVEVLVDAVRARSPERAVP